MLQDWCHITFLHWRYPAASLQRFLPPGLTVDVHDSTAWLGITPFVVQKLRPPFLPSVPWLSTFPETNVRTYVIGPDGSRGIWFFSLEAARRLAVAGARALYGLPYRWASMTARKEGELLHYESHRDEGGSTAATRVTVQIGPPVPSTPLEIFLTARFRLFSFRNNRLWFADVEHNPWPLRAARVERLEQTLLPSLLLEEPPDHPLVHYSRGVRTRISILQPITASIPLERAGAVFFGAPHEPAALKAFLRLE